MPQIPSDLAPCPTKEIVSAIEMTEETVIEETVDVEMIASLDGNPPGKGNQPGPAVVEATA